jgi:hypothetical protein
VHSRKRPKRHDLARSRRFDRRGTFPLARIPAKWNRFADGRVEERRGGSGLATRVPFPLPAHRTGRAVLPHPAHRLASSRDRRRRLARRACEGQARLRLCLEIELPLKRPDTFKCCKAHCQSPIFHSFESAPEVRALCSAGITRPQRSYGPVRRPLGLPAFPAFAVATCSHNGPPTLARTTFANVLCPLPRRIKTGASVGCLPLSRGLPQNPGGSASASLLSRPAQASLTLPPHWLAQPPYAAFVAGLRPVRLLRQTACQLPVQPTTHWVDTSSTGDACARGAQDSRQINMLEQILIAVVFNFGGICSRCGGCFSHSKTFPKVISRPNA